MFRKEHFPRWGFDEVARAASFNATGKWLLSLTTRGGPLKLLISP
jgi:hypothetical protein